MERSDLQAIGCYPGIPSQQILKTENPLWKEIGKCVRTLEGNFDSAIHFNLIVFSSPLPDVVLTFSLEKPSVISKSKFT